MPRTTGINSAMSTTVRRSPRCGPGSFIVNAIHADRAGRQPLGADPVEASQWNGRLPAGVHHAGAEPVAVAARRAQGFLVGRRRDPEMASFLRNINPTIEIFERVPGQ